MRQAVRVVVLSSCSVLLGCGPPDDGSAIRRPPSGDVRWDWQIGASAGRLRPPPGAVMLVADGFDTDAATVARLGRAGQYMVCYVNAGSWEPWRPDARRLPSQLRLHPDPAWPDERFVDVRDVFRNGSVLAEVLLARLRMCRDKGFDAVEPDNMFTSGDVRSGVIRRQDSVDFAGWFASAAHAQGLAVFQKNGAEEALARTRGGVRLVDVFDGIINEECLKYDECEALAEYARRGKPALNVEYDPNLKLDCARLRRLGVSVMRRDLGLVGPGTAGYVRETCP